MRIGVNTRFLLNGKLEGIGWFTYETMQRIVKAHPEHDFVFFFDRPFDRQFVFEDNVKPVVVYPPARAPFLWKLWFDTTLPYYLKKHKIDTFISPDGYCSLNTVIPQLMVLHDLAFEHGSFGLPEKVMNFYKTRVPQFVEKAKRIVTVSNFSKQDIIDQYQTKTPIDVIYNGFNNDFDILSDELKLEVRNRITNGDPYYLYVGAIHPRKNVLRLLKAFEIFKENDQLNYKLLLVGRSAWANNDLDLFYNKMKFKEDVVFLSHLAFEELKEVIGAAEVLFYPSIFEGFGIPILEGMSSGVPVVTSNTSSMPEVGGDAVLFVDPFSEKDILEKMNLLSKNVDLKRDMIKKGFIQKDKFSWDKAAEELWVSIDKMINNED